MSKAKSKPRRVRVPGGLNHHIYKRYDGQYEVGYRDSDGKLRWPGPFETIKQARSVRDDVLGRKGRGETVRPNPRLKFGEAGHRMLKEVAGLRDNTEDGYESCFRNHLEPRWGNRRLDHIDVTEAVALIGDLRAAGYAEWTIHGIVGVASRTFKFARRYSGWHGDNPFLLLEKRERPKPSATPERRIYTDDELAQVLVATTEPWNTLFQMADIMGGRISELLGLYWEDLDLEDLDAADITFTCQVTRKGVRVELKTEESKATLPLPRTAAVLLLKHKVRSSHTGPKAFVFASRTGRALSQRNVLRALYRAQEQARTPGGQPTFPELFEHDERGHLVISEDGAFVPNDIPRKKLRLPHFHSLRHGAAMDCDDAEEARDLLRHKNSNVTRTIYRAHFDDRRRASLRGKLEARHGETAVETADHSEAQQGAATPLGKLVPPNMHSDKSLGSSGVRPVSRSH
jgi:integrase